MMSTMIVTISTLASAVVTPRDVGCTVFRLSFALRDTQSPVLTFASRSITKIMGLRRWIFSQHELI